MCFDLWNCVVIMRKYVETLWKESVGLCQLSGNRAGVRLTEESTKKEPQIAKIWSSCHFSVRKTYF